MMKKRRNRWLTVCLAAAVLFIASAVRMFLRAEVVSGMIYCLFALVFLLLAFAYFKGKLK